MTVPENGFQPIPFLWLVGFLLLTFNSPVFGQDVLAPSTTIPTIDTKAVILIFDQLELPDLPKNLKKIEKGPMIFERLKSHAATTQNVVQRFLNKRKIPFQSFCIVNAIGLDADEELFQELQSFADIKAIKGNIPLKSLATFDEKEMTETRRSGIELPWGLTHIGADVVWQMGFRGQGVVVGGHDTGVEWSHPALAQRYRGNSEGKVTHDYNWHDAIHQISPLHEDSIITESTNPCGLNVRIPCDDLPSSHGTHTMGTMIGADPSDMMMIGVAPEAKWIAVRNMERGFGSLTTYLEGFEWFLAPTDLEGKNPDPARSPDVINNSWACIEAEGCRPENFALLETAVHNLRAAGIVVVSSAGNSGAMGCGTINTPAAIYQGSFTVGSIDSNDSLSGFSSRGPVLIDSSLRIKPNVTAPGRAVLSSIRGGKYGILSGTSMSGPHVAGLVALILSANPSLAGQVDLIEDIIERSAVPKSELDSCTQLSSEQPYPNALHGYGRIDALQAVEEALNISTATMMARNSMSLKIYPNPAQDLIQIELLPVDQTDKTIVIYDLLGIARYHIKEKNSHFSLQVGFLPVGLYLVQVFHGGSVVANRIIQIIP